MDNERNIQWLTGILEADGYFSLTNRGPRVGVAMLDLDVVQHVSKFLKCPITETKTPNGSKIMHTARTAKRAVLEPLLKEMQPFLGQRRRDQVKKILSHWENL